ncbi:MAG TPA: neutral zinc metallopeptidase [Candidatus Sumerlaeota bacterium]|nr:neutral zinc metallopeptidase [Candidatus Sumerlaeota bacterium]HOR28565.1 neutral zinc metallopeptidase [Candidatus Sumerlaeota bacterium]
MKWRTGRRSANVEDRRGRRPVGRMGGVPMVGGGMGLLLLLGISLLAGLNPLEVLTLMSGQGGGPATYEQVEVDPAQAETAEFVSVVLADTEDVWHALFAEMGRQYREPTLVLFSDGVESACGFADAAVGPFYCPADQQVYLDLTFFDELNRRFGAPGDFAQAYVIAHEIGHHVQHQLGAMDRVQSARGRQTQAAANEKSVRLELQADFLAGVWAHHAQRTRAILEPGDIEEALGAASAVGDDTLQRRAQGRVVPDAFTHGTAEQRMRWFRKGFETGDVAQGDTFAVPEP